jgi:hypothetical protein
MPADQRAAAAAAEAGESWSKLGFYVSSELTERRLEVKPSPTQRH